MTAVATSSYSAASSAIGYLYQCRYALLLLLQRARTDPTVQIAIEKFDDISFESNGTPEELIQTKHHVGHVPDLTDGSTDLWKTLRVWSDAVFNNQFPISLTTLTLVTSATCGAGTAAELLRPNEYSRNPQRAYNLLLAASGRMTGETLRPAKEAFLRLSEAQRKAMLNSVFVIDRAPNIIHVEDRLRDALGFPARAEHMSAFQKRLEGWWFGEVIYRLSGTKPDPITGSALLAEIDDLRDQFRVDSLPIDFAGAFPPEIPENDPRIFVQQLRLIALGPKVIRWAQVDFFRAYSQRSKWVDDNLLEHEYLNAYDDKLVEEWERKFDSHNEGRETTEDERAAMNRGINLYNHFQDNCHPIKPNCAEPYVGRGSYQMLANRLSVGWHPDFRQRLTTTNSATNSTTPSNSPASAEGNR